MKQQLSLFKDPLSYKQQRGANELIMKFRIICDVLRHHHSKTGVADKYGMGRNTVGNIIAAFRKSISQPVQAELLSAAQTFSQREIEEKLAPIKNTSTKPLGNKRSATKQQEQIILKYFHQEHIAVGADRMWMFLQRRKMKLGNDPPRQAEDRLVLAGLTKSRLKGIYKRNGLKAKKKRTSNGNVRPLYDYDALACFERLHYDTKTIPDQKALPEDIYEKFKLNKNLPVIEWNIIDSKSRFRFIAYSHERTSEFGLHFLLLVLQFIRANTLFPGMRIIIGTDNGVEFFSGSEKKQQEWNRMLDILNAEIYAYDPGWDVRKNLIERSHKTDDEEFFVPRGEFINDKKSFLQEASQYSHYFNSLRPHSGKNMQGKTPMEKLLSSGIYNARIFLSFPTMILEDHIAHIRQATEVIRIAAFVGQQKRQPSELISDTRFCSDLNTHFKNLGISAQNVLTYYLMGFSYIEKNVTTNHPLTSPPV